jgi:hypothetical protein
VLPARGETLGRFEPPGGPTASLSAGLADDDAAVAWSSDTAVLSSHHREDTDVQGLRERFTTWVAAVAGVAVFLGSAAVVVLSGGPTSAHSVAGEATEPYGGCAEAWMAPRSAGARLCRDLGYAVSARFVLSPRGVVLHSSLPHCRSEDGSGGRRPCTWNVGRRVDGNGVGLAYKVRRNMTARYVWAESPIVAGWRWVGERQAHRLARHFTRPSQRRSVTAWQRCVVRHAGTTWVKCSDGTRYGS